MPQGVNPAAYKIRTPKLPRQGPDKRTSGVGAAVSVIVTESQAIRTSEADYRAIVSPAARMSSSSGEASRTRASW
jgi:hypothetical protein